MITAATTTEDLIATIGNARLLGGTSFEQGCAILDAIEMFDRRVKPGTWQSYNTTCLRFVPVTDTWDTHQVVSEKIAQDVVAWTCRQLACGSLAEGAVYTAWVVIDRATRTVWVECSPVKDQRAQHPRAIREACEFPSSSRGTVSAHVFLRMGETWREVLDSVLEAYHEAKDLLDQFEGCDHKENQAVHTTFDLSGKLPSAAPVNQCMGCQGGWSFADGFHREPGAGLVACTASRYEAPASRAGRQ